MREVVVTGYGIVAPIGIGVPEFSRRMFTGDSGISEIRGTMVAPDLSSTVPRSEVVPDCARASVPPKTKRKTNAE